TGFPAPQRDGLSLQGPHDRRCVGGARLARHRLRGDRSVTHDARSVIAAAAAAHPHVLTWLEPLVMLSFAGLFVLYAFLFFKPEHVEHHPTRVLIGAALQGLSIGMLVGFVIMPLRIAFFVPDPAMFPDLPPPPSKGLASLSAAPAFVLLIVIR